MTLNLRSKERKKKKEKKAQAKNVLMTNKLTKRRIW